MPRGKRSPVGSTRVSPNGYHYTRTSTKWELTHVIIAEERLGRPLEEDERCRFKDGNRMNLRPENIEVYVSSPKTAAAQIAALKAKRDDLSAKIHQMELELYEEGVL
jgi:hypothetical protein